MANTTANDVILAGGCVHSPGCRWECPQEDVKAMPMADVSKIVVTIVPNEGDPIEYEYLPDEIDAVFFTLASVDRFIVPHYTVLEGFEFAKQLRDSAAEYARDVAGV